MTTTSKVIPLLGVLFSAMILVVSGYSSTTYYESGAILKQIAFDVPDEVKIALGAVILSGTGLGAVKSMVNKRTETKLNHYGATPQ